MGVNCISKVGINGKFYATEPRFGKALSSQNTNIRGVGALTPNFGRCVPPQSKNKKKREKKGGPEPARA